MSDPLEAAARLIRQARKLLEQAKMLIEETPNALEELDAACRILEELGGEYRPSENHEIRQ